ncbi:transmembrane protein 106B-like [Babylonia areolata]|uniref:transmembrane protein 106B-like n=1 Tax=Babylonia areolata TaxID=304850 RepID=UPI003FD06F8A
MALGGDYGSTSSTGSCNKDVSRESSGSTTHLFPSSSGRSTPVMNGRGSGGGEEGYEELLKDSVPCPTCRGLGRVPREQESELVALIPMKDKRLKPRRTWLYVAIAVFLCVGTAGTCMFFLFPRDVVISSTRPLLQPIFLDLNVSAMFVNFTVMNFYNFTNSNFVPVEIVGSQMTAMYDERMMSKAVNTSSVEVPIRSSLQYGIVMNFVLSKTNDWGFLVSFCEDHRPWVHNLPITFELVANYTYLGHVEQTTLTTYQQVSCYNSSAHTTVSTPVQKKRSLLAAPSFHILVGKE